MRLTTLAVLAGAVAFVCGCKNGTTDPGGTASLDLSMLHRDHDISFFVPSLNVIERF
jgi:hypothetical protein